MSFVQTRWALAGAVVVGLWTTGCRQIAGIEERTYHSDAGADDAGAEPAYPDDAACTSYCETLEQGCNDTTSGVFAYRKDTKYCQALCPHLKLSDDGSPEGNTFDCRAEQAKRAFSVRSDRNEGSTNCRAAGAGGNGTCGTNCESYCELYQNVCAESKSGPNPNCLEQCKMLRDDPSIDADQSFLNNVDTVQCRLTHLGAAALSDLDVHCEHASIYVDKETPCLSKTPRCEDYCSMLMKACTDNGKTPLKQFDSEAECVTVCKKGMTNSVPLSADETQDKTHDTLACRRYHTYNAFLSGETHCNHSGPTGDGHCSRICPVYCNMVKEACAASFDSTFKDDEGCRKNCATLLGIPEEEKQLDLGYSTTTGAQPGNTIQCRFYHTVKAFSKPSECAAAVGGAECAP